MTTPLQPPMSNLARRVQSAGFSLAEVMVAMVIGLLTMIIIMQSYASFEGQKRTTTSGSDTQENGLTAMHAIETDARMAGFGLMTPNGLACTHMNFSYNGASSVAAIAPVMIVDGDKPGVTSGLSDTITFTYSTSPTGGNPTVLTGAMSNSNSDLTVDWANGLGFTGDQDLLLIGTPGSSTPCSRLAYTINPDPLTNNMLLYNPEVSVNIFPPGGYVANSSFVLNMGGFAQNEYGIEANDLYVQDVGPQASWAKANGITATSRVHLASNVVNLQVQYGVAPTNTSGGLSSPGVTCWTDAVDRRADATAAADCKSDWRADSISTADAMRIKAIRIAVVARSSLQEKPASGVGTTCDATLVAPISWMGGPAIDLSTNDTATDKWQCHRYRVYQTVIPLRNMIWANL